MFLSFSVCEYSIHECIANPPFTGSVADHLERLLLRYDELQKANTLLQAQLLEVAQERDSLRSRLAAARSRVDALLMRLPAAELRVAAAQDAFSVIEAPADGSSGMDAPVAPGEETA